MYHLAISHYRHHEWDKAEELLNQLITTDSGRKLYQLDINRIIEHHRNPPPFGWSGIIIFTQK